MFSNLSLNNNDRSGKYNDVDTTLQSVERKFQENRFIGIDLLKFQVLRTRPWTRSTWESTW